MIYSFENFSLNVDSQELRRGGALVAVEPQVLDLLQYLIRNRERVVSKDDLIASIWNGRIVSESTLTSRITAVRQAVGDNGDDQRLIRTVARKGIRFVGEVNERERESDASPGLLTDQVASTARLGPAPNLPDKPSIAVLPFTNMSGDPEQEYFSDGITEDIINALSRLRWFFVIARNSTFVYKGQAADIRQVGRDLGVRYVLEGSVRKSGQRVRISAQLADASNGNELWSERYDRELKDFFELQDEITVSVISAIEPRLVAAESHRTRARSASDLDAWDSVARALVHFWKLTTTECDKAIAILQQTVKRHPDYAPAHSLLAFALLVSTHMGWIPSGDDRKLAAILVQRAVELDDSDPWAYLALGHLSLIGRETDQAVRHFRTALELNPNFAAAYGFVGYALGFDGRTEEALAQFDRAIRMSPRDPLNSIFVKGIAVSHYLAGRFPEAVAWSRRALQARPGLTSAQRILCASLAQAGYVEETAAAMRTLRELQPDLSIDWIRQFVPYTAGPMEQFLEGMRKAGLTD